MKALSSRTVKAQGGVTLIEVLIAILVLSFGLLGLASLQLLTLRNNQSSFDRSRAIMAVYSVADLMRANLGVRGELDTGSTVVATQITAWETILKQHLGTDATGAISCTSTAITPLFTPQIDRQTCTVTITWDDSLVEGGGTQTLTTQVEL